MGKNLFVFMLLLALFTTDETFMTSTEAKICQNRILSSNCVKAEDCKGICREHMSYEMTYLDNSSDAWKLFLNDDDWELFAFLTYRGVKRYKLESLYFVQTEFSFIRHPWCVNSKELESQIPFRGVSGE
ncbi:unnamed protein product [Lactuca saligna]|uniref:Uncharacterized protein n=1 Tax=Lactuca saligna TaxID=75948 RepID=A0AA35ZZ50_LACSI|nr:unnamed protein product [Lactuca saligna]